MRRFGQYVILIGTLLAASTSVQAQVCQESTATSHTGAANLTCDMRYRDSIITCDTKNAGDVIGTRPSCPKKPMPMIETPQMSYIADYTKYLYIYPTDPEDRSRPYGGSFSVGTPGNAAATFQLFGNSVAGSKRLAACTTQIKTPEDIKFGNDEDWAKLIRLQIDNCTNQYILNTARFPFQKEMPNRAVTMDAPETDPTLRETLETGCQPLKIVPDTTNEYSPTDYLKAAWIKTMQDPGYRKSMPDQLRCVSCTASRALALTTSDETKQIPCDHEPHLPCKSTGGLGVALENPIDPPNPFEEVTLSGLSAVPYEEIIDPTHPFSPRWDFLLTDRDYSNEAARWFGLSDDKLMMVAAIYGMHKLYMSKTKNTIFCAGIKEAKNETDSKKKADKEVHVDVLEFRRKPFENTLYKRVVYNTACYYHRAQFTSGNDGFVFPVWPASFCATITYINPYRAPYVFGRDYDCWKCFGLNDKVDDEDQHPPCTTNYLGKDLEIQSGYIPGGLNAYKWEANCGNSMQNVCRDLRKPFTPLNKLKMRYHNPEDKDDSDRKNQVLNTDSISSMVGIKDGALEGMTFREYFGNHMPYPRLWDTGKSLQSAGGDSDDPGGQPAMDTTGQYTAIVGVGREAAAKSAADNAPTVDGKKRDELFPDQRCKTMGWGGVTADLTAAALGRDYRFGQTNFAGVSVNWPDPMTSWTELKLYQTRTQRLAGLSCIARYEKIFKPGSAENMVLMASGAEWQSLIIEKCERGPNGSTKNCKFMKLKDYISAGQPADDDSYVYMKYPKPEGLPNSWRGYMASFNLDNKFPLFGNPLYVPYSGLNKAEEGDIIMLPYGHEKSVAAIMIPSLKDDIGLAKLSFVIETRLPGQSDCEDENNCYVKVLEPDNGKWPDICGTTDAWGEMRSRTYFKPGHLPQAARDEYARIGTTSNCMETRLVQCEMSDWDNMLIYRIRDDQRSGCKDDEKASNCK